MWDWETSLIASLLRIEENIWKQDIKILSHVLVWLIFLPNHFSARNWPILVHKTGTNAPTNQLNLFGRKRIWNVLKKTTNRLLVSERLIGQRWAQELHWSNKTEWHHGTEYVICGFISMLRKYTVGLTAWFKFTDTTPTPHPTAPLPTLNLATRLGEGQGCALAQVFL